MKLLSQDGSRLHLIASLILTSLLLAGCQRNIFQAPTIAPKTLRDVPALKLNFRFEADVPAPSAANQPQPGEERVQSVQSDFDANRPQEILDKTVLSPDKQRVLAVYHKAEDLPTQYRLDMYAADGKLLRKITPNSLAVHFPDTIVWSPDSNNVAFVGMIRLGNAAPTPSPEAETTPTPAPAADANTEAANANAETDANAAPAPASAPPTPEPPASVLTFRTEQIYICNTDGGDLKPLTQNEGMIYFYFAWSPDGTALAALAATWQEWRYEQLQTEQRGEIFTPSGRPRLVEKNGRVRLLDDRPTRVRPVWSPDSAKVAVAIDKEIRIFDAIGDAPTQASIPLRNPLLISSKKYDDDLKAKEGIVDANANANAGANADVGTLPDENSLVSFNPIISLEWTEDKMLYLQTGYVKELKDAANSARSYLRWHRLIFSPQAVAY